MSKLTPLLQWAFLAIPGWAALRALRAKFADGGRRKRRDYIDGYAFPPGLIQRAAKKRPGLAPDDWARVEQGLRQFFRAYLDGGQKFVSMPSQIVDEVWHEFILYTKNYELFCGRAFGRFLHHTPAAVLGPARRKSNEGLRRTWWYACRAEGIDPKAPHRLPLLFALDAQLGIADGFHYVPDCAALRRNGRGDCYCGGDFSDSGIDGDLDGFGGEGDSGDGDSGGDGGCGGGCGGD